MAGHYDSPIESDEAVLMVGKQVVVGYGHPGAITMSLDKFHRFRVNCFSREYNIVSRSDEWDNDEKFVLAVAATSDELFAESVQRDTEHVLAAVREFIGTHHKRKKQPQKHSQELIYAETSEGNEHD
jgi:hypothetical protein